MPIQQRRTGEQSEKNYNPKPLKTLRNPIHWLMADVKCGLGLAYVLVEQKI